jgi:2-phosphosulfolactate phosphatase
LIPDSSGYDVHCEWGEAGATHLSVLCTIIVIVDVLSFCTTVEVGTSRRAAIIPFSDRDERAVEHARRVGAVLAGPRGHRFSLSPVSMLQVEAGLRLVIPSPNGSRLSLATGSTPTLAGCLRNARAIAEVANRFAGGKIGIVPAGEAWEDGSFRPCLEDWLGAGAIVAQLSGSWSPEARSAVDSFQGARSQLQDRLDHCISGLQLRDRGFGEDVRLAAELDVSECVPCLVEGAYVAATLGGIASGEDVVGVSWFAGGNAGASGAEDIVEPIPDTHGEESAGR